MYKYMLITIKRETGLLETGGKTFKIYVSKNLP